MKLVDKNFKAPRVKPKSCCMKLMDEIERLKAENELKLFTYNENPDYEVISIIDWKDHEEKLDKIDQLASISEAITKVKWRIDLGIDYADTELKELNEELERLA